MGRHLGGVLQFVCEHDGELPVGEIIPHPDPQVPYPIGHANEAKLPAVRSATAKFIATPLYKYKEVTIRNLNTTLKLNALLDEGTRKDGAGAT